MYLWDLEHGFAGVVLIKKVGDNAKRISGCWDSIHVVEVQEKLGGRNAHYKLTSTVMLWCQTKKESSGIFNLGGSLTRQSEKDCAVNESSPHVCNIGGMVEDMENNMRTQLNDVYFGNTKGIVDSLRDTVALQVCFHADLQTILIASCVRLIFQDEQQKLAFQVNLAEALKNRSAK